MLLVERILLLYDTVFELGLRCDQLIFQLLDLDIASHDCFVCCGKLAFEVGKHSLLGRYDCLDSFELFIEVSVVRHLLFKMLLEHSTLIETVRNLLIFLCYLRISLLQHTLESLHSQLTKF